MYDFDSLAHMSVRQSHNSTAGDLDPILRTAVTFSIPPSRKCCCSDNIFCLRIVYIQKQNGGSTFCLREDIATVPYMRIQLVLKKLQ
jgi:hypothetical protein